MTNTPKPPMTLYLQNEQSLNEEQWRDDDVTWCRDKIFRHDVGPYVHLEQFKAALIERAEKLAINAAEAAKSDLPYPLDDCVNYWLLDAYDELAKEIKEGKRESWKHC